MFAPSSSAPGRPARRRRLLASPALIIAAIAIAGTGSVALAADAAVAIANFAFNPPSVTINVGDSVTWTNNDDVSHTATANDASFDTGNLGSGASGAVTFNTAGSFPYHCSIHPQMAGTVIVQGAAATPPPAATPGPTPPKTNTASPASTPSTGGTGIAIFGVTLVAFAIALRIVARREPR